MAFISSWLINLETRSHVPEAGIITWNSGSSHFHLSSPSSTSMQPTSDLGGAGDWTRDSMCAMNLVTNWAPSQSPVSCFDTVYPVFKPQWVIVLAYPSIMAKYRSSSPFQSNYSPPHLSCTINLTLPSSCALGQAVEAVLSSSQQSFKCTDCLYFILLNHPQSQWHIFQVCDNHAALQAPISCISKAKGSASLKEGDSNLSNKGCVSLLSQPKASRQAYSTVPGHSLPSSLP